MVIFASHLYGWLIKFNTEWLQILVVSYLHSTKP